VFEYVAYLAVPIFLGLVTLVVAIASWRVARSSYKLAESIVYDGDRAAREARKLAIADQAFLWGGSRWTDQVATVKEKARRAAEIGRLSIALTESGLLGAGVLQEILWDLDQAKHPKPLQEPFLGIANSYVGGAFSTLTERAIITWLRRPDDLAGLAVYVHQQIPSIMKTGRKKAKSAVRRMARKAARIDPMDASS